MAIEDRFSHIVLATDGSEQSQRAARVAGSVASGLGLPVIVLTVDDKDEEMPAELAAMRTSRKDIKAGRKEHFAEIAANARKKLEEQQVTVEEIVTEGDPAQTIMRVAHDYPAPMVVIGRHGHTGFRELLMGSVSHKVTHTADCPVLVVN
ncbi:universal stress protein [Aquisalimonas sp.]|uniref:universal stress protein n=1 Tax=Aquisalimonas sp. TaxID=1872621 RepID=UPI0025BF0C23|nr:universal stress protein [Aquisalimonas sp.]